jgi:hypothetical protein
MKLEKLRETIHVECPESKEICNNDYVALMDGIRRIEKAHYNPLDPDDGGCWSGPAVATATKRSRF